MDRHAELLKLKAEALDRVEQILAHAKSEGRDEDHLTDEEVTAVEKETGAVEAHAAEIAKIERSRAAVAKKREAEAVAQKQPPARPSVPALPRSEDTERAGFRTFAEFLSATRFAAINNGVSMDERLRPLMATGMSRLSGGDGGFLTPPAFETAIWDGVMQKSEVNLISMCDQRTITNKSLTLNATNETSRADGSRFGGARGYWLNEGGTLTASRPTYRQIELMPKKLAVLYYATEELLEDANALTQELEKVAAGEIRYMANRAIVRGTGVGQPKGILQGTAGTTSPRISITVETGQTSSTPFVTENIDKMWARLAPESISNAVWLIHPEARPYLEQLGRDVGTSGLPAFMPSGGVSQTPYDTLKGRPVIPCEWCSGVNTEGDLILADMRGYLVGTKGGVRSESSIHVQFLTDEVAFRFIFRIDGQPWRLVPTTLENGSSFTVSEFVTLATRS